MALKEDMPTSVISSLTDTYVWLGVRSKSGCHKDICLEEIGLRVENVITVMSLIINIMIGSGGKGLV